jgi:predicted AAA+ superfamily ATPase
VIRKGITIVQAIQVCHSFNTDQTRTREVKGLLEALNMYGLAEGLILLHDTQEHTIEEDGKVIRVMPVWKWLLK